MGELPRPVHATNHRGTKLFKLHLVDLFIIVNTFNQVSWLEPQNPGNVVGIITCDGNPTIFYVPRFDEESRQLTHSFEKDSSPIPPVARAVVSVNQFG